MPITDETHAIDPLSISPSGEGLGRGVTDFSVIVPAFNAEKTLSFCLESLLAQTVPKEQYEVIVVDDGSTDRTSEIARRYDVRYFFQNNRGPATARNHGARVARGHIILFTDSDCVPASNWIEEMTMPFTDPDVSAVKGSYRTQQRELVARFAQQEFEDRYDMLLKHSHIDMVDSYSAAFRKEVFTTAGGFDESFPKANNEDTELSYRLASRGYKMIFKPSAIVYHRHPATLSRYLKVKFWRGYWRMMVYRRYPQKALKDSYTPNVLKVQTLLAAISLPFCLFMFFGIGSFSAIGVIWSVILFTAVPFSIKTYQKDKWAGTLSPIIILCRSIVFAMGSLMGIFTCLMTRLTGYLRNWKTT